MQIDGGPASEIDAQDELLRSRGSYGDRLPVLREKHPAWKWVSPHTFRKTVGTLIERERGLGDAASQLGHSSEKITQKHYVQMGELAPDYRDVLERFSD